jgi:DNA-directed RNA polymerase specialized sigma subunit
VILVLRYYQGMTLADLAPYAGVTPDEASRLHQATILEIHAEMLKVVA